MFRTIVGLASIVAAFSTASAASAQELWRGATVGMSVAEVQQLLPTAAAVSGDEIQGEVPLLRVQGFDLVRTPFRADFYFAQDSLKTVILRPVAAQSATASMMIAEDIIPQMTVKYGPPFDCEINRRSISSLTSTACKWLSNGTRIGVFASHMGYAIPNLAIVYDEAELDTDNL